MGYRVSPGPSTSRRIRLQSAGDVTRGTLSVSGRYETVTPEELDCEHAYVARASALLQQLAGCVESLPMACSAKEEVSSSCCQYSSQR